MVSRAAMRGQRAVETACRCWNPVVLLLVSLLASLVLVAVSVLLRLGDLKISKRSASAVSANEMQNPVEPQYQIRLVNGRNGCEGRVEVSLNGFSGTVCDDDWDMVDANVVCRQLGCGVAVAVGSSSQFGQGSGFIALDNVDCKGSERNLSQCRSLGWGVHNCYHYEDVGVACREPLSQKSKDSVETTTPSVVIPGLRVTTVPPVATITQRFGDMTSTDLKTRLDTALPSTTTVTTVSTTILTTTPTTIQKKRGLETIRLVNGQNKCEGRVEVLYKTAWGTVCDDDWEFDNAVVVCRQLGCGPAKAAKSLAFFGYGSGPILLDNVKCNGIELELSDCVHVEWGQHNCGHHEDAGVICETFDAGDLSVTQNVSGTIATTQRFEGMLRLVGGQHQCEGRVEIYLNSEWGTVCDDAWDLPDAQVVCLLVGCGEAIVAWGEAHFGPGTGTIQLDNLKCTGAEASLLGCSHISWNVHNCDHSEDAGVTCSLS
ncbi:scavenger receptor cysteine-rich domain-containing group B protein isoform X2 [Kryptolebias marmoratus]|uniref:scavenger receptor cysteine-rich domain-containing group B protein isoform X2 n=1 Tax=Kryptolebias marmoratus TaxID=37003 RepID=UPI0007F93252|nr:scavenger receptor cysteine-rich domain-containing group B protein isoform X2 [Kryptolebias marmoratus]